MSITNLNQLFKEVYKGAFNEWNLEIHGKNVYIVQGVYFHIFSLNPLKRIEIGPIKVMELW